MPIGVLSSYRFILSKAIIYTIFFSFNLGIC